MTELLPFMRGVLAATSLVAAVFFARFYKRSRDRFFLLFASAFAMLAVNWVGAGLMDPHEEARKVIYVVRLFAFLLIIAAVVEKNRAGGGKA